MEILTLHNNLASYLILGALLFSIGIFGMVSHRSLIGMLISAELVLGGAAMNFMAFNRFTAPDPAVGQIFTLFIMAIAAAEAAIGLSIVIAIYRLRRSIKTKDMSNLRH